VTRARPTSAVVRRAVVEIGPPLVLAVAFLGPGLGRGALMNLDLMVLPEMDVPSGVWGLGPEFPRRLPLWLPITMFSSIVPATLTTKLLLIAIFVIGWCGMVRWARSLGVTRPEIAAGLYILSPFLLTRLGVGHVGMVLAAAVLPWVAPRLLEPARDLRRLFLAAALLGLCGYSGGVLAVIVVACAAIVSNPRGLGRNLAAVGVTLLAQTPWLLPAVLVTLSVSVDAASAAPFGVQVGGHPLQVLSLSAGNGYWNTYFQVGPTGWTSAAVGAVLLGLAVYGSARLPPHVRRPVVVLGAATWILAALSAFSWADGVLDTLTGTVVGGLLRDPQRLLTLHMLWLAPSACLGAARMNERLTGRRSARTWSGALPVLPAAAVLVVSTPGLWGLGGNLDAVPLPRSWVEARELVGASPGPAVALPWTQYLNQDLPGAPVRRVLNPAPFLLGGDVISSSDSLLGDEIREAGDPREPVVAEAFAALIEDGAAASPVLQRLGVRWVVLQTTTPLADRYAPLRDDPGVEVVLERPELTVFSVNGWQGLARDRSGAPIPVSVAQNAFYDLGGPGDGPGVLARAGSGGWMQGWSRATTTTDGLLSVPSTSGVVWNIATPLALTGQALFAVALGWALLQGRREDKPCHRAETRVASAQP
jgi:hypothetical protein